MSATSGNAVSVTIATALVSEKVWKSKLNTPNAAPTVKPTAKIKMATSLKVPESIGVFSREVKADRIIYTQTWADLNGYLKEKKPLKPEWPRKPIRSGDHAIYAVTNGFVKKVNK